VTPTTARGDLPHRSHQPVGGFWVATHQPPWNCSLAGDQARAAARLLEKDPNKCDPGIWWSTFSGQHPGAAGLQPWGSSRPVDDKACGPHGGVQLSAPVGAIDCVQGALGDVRPQQGGTLSDVVLHRLRCGRGQPLALCPCSPGLPVLLKVAGGGRPAGPCSGCLPWSRRWPALRRPGGVGLAAAR